MPSGGVIYGGTSVAFFFQVVKTAKNLKDKGRAHGSMLLYGHGDGGGGPS